VGTRVKVSLFTTTLFRNARISTCCFEDYVRRVRRMSDDSDIAHYNILREVKRLVGFGGKTESWI